MNEQIQSDLEYLWSAMQRDMVLDSNVKYIVTLPGGGMHSFWVPLESGDTEESVDTKARDILAEFYLAGKFSKQRLG